MRLPALHLEARVEAGMREEPPRLLAFVYPVGYV